ncbi:hypothetical protein BSn5_05270 [Bacillus subtilis BSn5]|nr:hypothetical protein BSn5_05270 [Bacillus subtilis BSn5]
MSAREKKKIFQPHQDAKNQQFPPYFAIYNKATDRKKCKTKLISDRYKKQKGA